MKGQACRLLSETFSTMHRLESNWLLYELCAKGVPAKGSPVFFERSANSPVVRAVRHSNAFHTIHSVEKATVGLTQGASANDPEMLKTFAVDANV